MTFRESNAVFLEVLQAAPAVGVPMEVDIFDGASPATLLEHLEGAEAVQFTLTLNEVGAGQFRLNRHDPKARPEIVDRENLAKIKIGGIYRFAFWMTERAVETLEEDGEEGGEYWIIGGPEAIVYLDRAVWAPLAYATGGSSFLDEETGRWSFENEEAGDIMARAIVEARGRSPDPLEFLTDDFGSHTDSQGNAWPHNSTVDLDAGTGYLATLKMLAALGVCDFRMRHDLRLQMYVELGRHFEVGGDGTGTVVFRAGQNVTTKLRKRVEGGAVKSRAWVKGTGDQFFEVLRPDIEADPYVRRRESFLSFGNSADPTTVQRAGEADLESRLRQGQAIAFGAEHLREKGGYQPFVDYDLGDWCTLDEPGVYDLEPFRIVGLSFTQEEDDFAVSIEANSIEYEALLKLERMMKGSSSGSGSTGGSSSNLSPGGTGSGAGATDTKVAVEPGDKASFLLSKLQAGDGIAVTLAGSSGNRKVEIAAEPISIDDLLDVDLTGLADGDGIVYDETLGLFVPGAASGGGGGDPLASMDYSEANAQISASSSQAILSRTLTLPAGRYLVIGKAWIWSSGVGTLYLRANGVTIGGTDDPRMDVAQRIFFAPYVHGGGAVTFDIWHAQESGTTQYGSGGDPRFGRELLVVPLAESTAAPADTGYALDVPPALANAMDDEFQGPTLDPKWTKDATWTAAAAETFENSELWKEYPTAASGAGARFLITQPVPAGDWTFAAKLAHHSNGNPSTGAGDAPMVGIYLLDAAGTGAANAVYNSTVLEAFVWWRFVTNAFSARAGYGTYRQYGIEGTQARPLWLRVRRAGATYYASASFDGRRWMPEFTYTGAAIAPTVIGIGAAYNRPQPGRFAFDWFRRLA